MENEKAKEINVVDAQIEGNTFSFKEIESFDRHISQSIVGFDVLYTIIREVSKKFIYEGTNVYDLGCSTGKLLNLIYQDNKGVGASYIGYDNEDNLLPKKNTEDINFFKRDITDPTLKLFNTNLIISVFTLQFLSRSDRESLIDKMYKSLNEGGALIVAEKIVGGTGVEEEILSTASRHLKKRYFSDEVILGKEARLRHIMRPVTSQKFQMSIGSWINGPVIFPIWQALNFKCWLIIKD